MSIEKDFLGYSNFLDVENKLLQAYNRLMVMKNINQDHGMQHAAAYREQFDEADSTRMVALTMDIMHLGIEVVKRRLSDGEVT